MTIIKADPGFELLAAHHDGEFKIERSPIVAWRIEGDFAEPIALNPLFDGAFLTAVKCPSREIIARDHRHCELACHRIFGRPRLEDRAQGRRQAREITGPSATAARRRCPTGRCRPAST